MTSEEIECKVIRGNRGRGRGRGGRRRREEEGLGVGTRGLKVY